LIRAVTVGAAFVCLQCNFIFRVTPQRFLPLTSLEVFLQKDCAEFGETSVKTGEECIPINVGLKK